MGGGASNSCWLFSFDAAPYLFALGVSAFWNSSYLLAKSNVAVPKLSLSKFSFNWFYFYY